MQLSVTKKRAAKLMVSILTISLFLKFTKKPFVHAYTKLISSVYMHISQALKNKF